MLKDIAPKGQATSVRKARSLRAKMSLPEVLLWRLLRSRPGGLKYRRQHANGPYILDFYCADARLVIEVDGASHRTTDRPTRDEARDDWFLTAGTATLRLAAGDVLADPVGVAEQIALLAAGHLPLHHPAAPGGSPPRDELGEDPG